MLSGMNQHLGTVPAQWTAIWHSQHQCWLDDSPPTPLLMVGQHSTAVYRHTLTVWLTHRPCHSASTYYGVLGFSGNGWGRQDGSNGGESMSDARVEDTSIRLLLINSHWWTQVTREIVRMPQKSICLNGYDRSPISQRDIFYPFWSINVANDWL